MKKAIFIKQKDNGRYRLDLDPRAMKALVSMVRLEMANGFMDQAPQDAAEGAERLLAAIDRNY